VGGTEGQTETARRTVIGALGDAKLVADDRAVRQIAVKQVRDPSGRGWVVLTLTALGGDA
jgi:hypothetical protein